MTRQAKRATPGPERRPSARKRPHRPAELDAELLAQTRRHRRAATPARSPKREDDPLRIETNVTIASGAEAEALYRRQIAALARIVRHAVETSDDG
jgi:hypothetical protein